MSDPTLVAAEATVKTAYGKAIAYLNGKVYVHVYVLAATALVAFVAGHLI